MTTSRGGARVLGSFSNYDATQAFVDDLSDQHRPVEHLQIVGSDLRLVEQVTGRMTTGRSALAGAGAGAWFGLLLSIFFGLFLSEDASFLSILLYWTVLGAVVGAALGALRHSTHGGARDFASVSTLQPGRYDVCVDAEAEAEFR